MSLSCPIGPESNIPNASQCQRLFLEQPILSLDDMIYFTNKVTSESVNK